MPEHHLVRLNFPLALTFAAVMLTGLGCAKPPAAEQPRIAVTVLTVSETQQSNSGAYTASFQPSRQTAVSFQVGGNVDFIKQIPGADGRPHDLQGGDLVKAHDLLGSVKSDTYEAQVSQSESALAGARAVFEKAKQDFDRDAQLLSQHIIARETYDLSAEQYQSAQSQVAQAEAAVKQAQINLGYCKLASPMDGVVLTRGIEVGSLAGPTTVAFQIADTSEMKAVFGGSDIQVAKLKQGQTQTLTSEAIPGVPLIGTITRIAPNADPTTRIFDVEITVPNKDGKIRTGMIASLRIAGAAASTSAQATLPLNAIVRPPNDQKDFAVYVVEEDAGKTMAKLRTVRLGDIVGNDIAVLSGVKMGDQVVVRGATMVSDGTEVTIIP
jgi:multidrug efflux system membrane fusion protein